MGRLCVLTVAALSIAACRESSAPVNPAGSYELRSFFGIAVPDSSGGGCVFARGSLTLDSAGHFRDSTFSRPPATGSVPPWCTAPTFTTWGDVYHVSGKDIVFAHQSDVGDTTSRVDHLVGDRLTVVIPPAQRPSSIAASAPSTLVYQRR